MSLTVNNRSYITITNTECEHVYNKNRHVYRMT